MKLASSLSWCPNLRIADRLARCFLPAASLIALLVSAACSKENKVDASTTQCGDNSLDCVPCSAGEHQCAGAVLKVCQTDGQGFDSVQSCATEALCVAGLPFNKCSDPVCNLADTKCVGPTMQVCAAGRDKLETTLCPTEASCMAGLKDGKCAAGECSMASECAGEDTECKKRSCISGVCDYQLIAAGTPLVAQVTGDCKLAVCDGAGATTTTSSDTDKPSDANECTTTTCSGGVPQVAWSAAGTTCSGSGVCDGAGYCSLGCVPGESKCAGDVLQTCQTNGTWDAGSECVNSTCIGTACVGNCKAGSKQCDGNAIVTCGTNGEWSVTGTGCVDSACSAGACVGTCVPGTKRCAAKDIETCDPAGVWQMTGTCSFLPLLVCSAGACVSIPSCEGLPETCGPNNSENCCTSALVSVGGGAYPMGRGSGIDACPAAMTCYPREEPEHDASISDFRLDLYEVTVGRFRKFVEAYAGAPAEGAGADPLLSGTGWQSAWSSWLPADKTSLKASLKCEPSTQSWTDPADAYENRPINCVSWYEAFAFCAWDGGWLPTEAEWEKAAAGGTDNRLYPWGSEAPTNDYAYADCTADESVAASCALSDVLAVGSRPLGKGKYGHYDLAGSMHEWAMDWYSETWYAGDGNSCVNCANLAPASERVIRGGTSFASSDYFRAASRYHLAGQANVPNVGFRCARSPL